VYGVASFYAQFRFTPIGRQHIMVCRGTSCHVRGAPRILAEIERQLGIKEGETTADLEYSLETVACIGACGLSPCLTINKQVEAKTTPRRVAELLRKADHAGDGS
jgi:NADH-quinone oxidoreductase subunit E